MTSAHYISAASASEVSLVTVLDERQLEADLKLERALCQLALGSLALVDSGHRLLQLGLQFLPLVL